MSLHSFDPEVAKCVGVNAAVIYQNILFWTRKNAANGKHVHEGYVWTYNSVKALNELFGYLTPDQIRRAIAKLLEAGLIAEGNYNVSAYDRTKWYGVPCQVHLAKTPNGVGETHKPIPDSKPDSKPDGKIDISETVACDAYNAIAERVGWPVVQKKSKARETAAHQRMKDCGGFEGWLAAMERAAQSDFLLGKATGTTPACFDWLNAPRNFTKLIEGNYDNRPDVRAQKGTTNGKRDGEAAERARRAGERWAARAVDFGEDRDAAGPLFSAGQPLRIARGGD
jgi:hypothetical protein